MKEGTSSFLFARDAGEDRRGRSGPGGLEEAGIWSTWQEAGVQSATWTRGILKAKTSYNVKFQVICAAAVKFLLLPFGKPSLNSNALL